MPRAGRRAAGWLLPRQQVRTVPASRCFAILPSSSQPSPSQLRVFGADPQSRPLHVLYRDSHIIVTNKAAGVLSQPDSQTEGVATDQLSIVRAHVKDTTGKPGGAYVGLVHRLDRNVTGCMVIALRSKAAARLSYDFKHRLVSKTYVCMVAGKLHGAGMLADILVHGQENVTKVAEAGAKKEKQSKREEEEMQKKALLHYKSLGIFQHPRGGAQTLVQIRLVTGKKHQIRAQLSHLGHPIVGDIKYDSPTRFRDKFIALHCCTLSFRHPSVEHPASLIGNDNAKNKDRTLGKPTDQKSQRRKMTVHAPLPETWRARFGDEVVRKVEELQRSTGEQ
eukprot:evm.model.NODE_2941_length_19835_cov_19.299471.5